MGWRREFVDMILSIFLRKIGFFLLLSLFLYKPSSGQILSAADSLNIKKFTEYVSTRNIDELAKMFAYPIKRNPPLPSINNEKEFKQRYSEMFDSSFVRSITMAGSINRWEAVGWRGIMFNDGDIWFNYAMENSRKSNYDWHLILSVNYHSEYEKNRIFELKELERDQLHESLKTDFFNPILIMETERFRIRIDKLNRANYRYASWSINKEMSEEPDLILLEGKRISDGTGGNHYYRFDNGNYSYFCFINPMRRLEDPEASLAVFMDVQPDKYPNYDYDPILTEPAKIVRN